MNKNKILIKINENGFLFSSMFDDFSINVAQLTIAIEYEEFKKIPDIGAVILEYKDAGTTVILS